MLGNCGTVVGISDSGIPFNSPVGLKSSYQHAESKKGAWCHATIFHAAVHSLQVGAIGQVTTGVLNVNGRPVITS